MFEATLFLGFPVTDSYSKILEILDPKVKQLFIAENSAYLKEVIVEGQLYIGKTVNNCINIAELELVEKNIYSILHKITPHFKLEETPLLLFALNAS